MRWAPPVFRLAQENLLLEAFFNRDGDGDSGADHRVVAHADESHHLDVRRNGRGARELSVGVHAAHGVGHAIAGRTGGHVVGVERTAGAAAGSDGEVLLAVLDAPLLVGARDRMLEARRVGGVAGDGNAHVLELHDRDALGDVVGAVAVDLGARALGERLLGDDLDGFLRVVELRLHVGEAVDARNDVRGILAETVQNDAQVLAAHLVGVERDLDRAFGGRERLVTGEEREALRRIVEKHRAEVAVPETDLAVFGDGTWDAERLEADADGGGGVLGLGAALLERDRRADRVGPLGVFEADRLGFFDNLVGVDSGLVADLFALENRLDAEGLDSGEDLGLAALVTFKKLLGGGSLGGGLLRAAFLLSTCHFIFLLIPCADRCTWRRLRTGRRYPWTFPTLRSGSCPS